MSASEPPSDDVLSARSQRTAVVRMGEIPRCVTGIVGRDHELARVRALLEAAREGTTTTLVVQGEPGIGKTTLLEAAERMATGFRCLWVRGVESESVLAHAGLLQALGPVRDGLAEIPGAQATALSSALGWGPAAAPAERFLVAAAVLSLLAAESERAPVLVLVDDLQWVDRESAAALGFAARRLRDDPVCFVWAARSGSVPPEFVQGMPVLTLAGLSRDAARALAPGRVADGVVERLVDDTGGNPLGMLEIPAASPMPSASVPRRCPTRCRWATGLGSCTSSSSPACPLGLARRTAVRAQPLGYLRNGGCGARPGGVDGAAALDQALDHGVLVRHGAEIGFRHPLLRSAVLALATAAQQRSAHRALADVLADDPPSLAGTWHRAEAAAGPDHDSPRTWCAPRTRAVPARATPPRPPRWSGRRCSRATLR